MPLKVTSKDYVVFLKLVAEKIAESKEYITALDSAIGDGDHWVNINKGFQALVNKAEILEELSISEMFKTIGMTLMAAVGGSSGLLYGSAYLAASRITKNIEYLDIDSIYMVLESMSDEIMSRGKAEVGQKTMVDCIFPSVKAFRNAIDQQLSIPDLTNMVIQTAINGANNTLEMPAMKGRAYYQQDKGIGHLDPGAVTMSYQIVILMELINKITETQ